MRSLLGLHASAPALGFGSFRNQQMQSSLQRIARREWWLWLSALFMTLLSMVSLLLSFLPFLFRHTDHFYELRPDQAQWGTMALLLVFNSWLVYRQWSFRRQRSQAIAPNADPSQSAGELSDASGLDPVTGLYTRASIEPHLSKEMIRARRQNTSLSLATIHLDEFADFMQRYGASTSELALKEVARRLKRASRGSDFVVRLRTDNFMLVLTDCNMGEVKQILNRLGPLEVTCSGEKVVLSYSTGWVDYQPGEPPADLLNRAEQILLLYKKAAKDTLPVSLIAS